MSRIKCFWMEPLEECRQWLRTYEREQNQICPADPNGYHQAMIPLPDGKMEYYEHELWPGRKVIRRVGLGDRDYPHEQYPTHCACGHEFSGRAERHVHYRQLYQRVDTGEKTTIDEAPAGAMWNAWWYPKAYQGPDGKSIMVKTPGGEWCIDSRASNCTMKDEDTHKCWIRHGEPPELTVDKNGFTCAAGAGSIAQPGYHGFLRNGYLEQC